MKNLLKKINIFFFFKKTLVYFFLFLKSLFILNTIQIYYDKLIIENNLLYYQFLII